MTESSTPPGCEGGVRSFVTRGRSGTSSSPGAASRLVAALAVAGILTCDALGPENQAPQPVGSISEQVVEVDSAVVVDVAGYFMDPDGDTLTFTAISSSAAVVTATASGSMVTVTGVAAGSTMVTVTARDPEGLAAEQSFGVAVPNRAPATVGAIADQAVYVDSVVVVDVAEYFADPDGDALEYSVSASDTTWVAVTVAESMVTVTGVAVGSATVTVTAVDPGGLSAVQSFGVAVPNRAPGAVGTIADLEVQVDSVVALEISGYFTDPDRDVLEYSAASSDTTRVTVALVGDTVTVTGLAAGNTTVTVTARDPGGLSAEQSFAVEVPNRAPEAVGAIADVEVYVDGEVVVDVAAGFADPDGDELEFSAVASDTTRATVAVAGSLVTVTGVAVGSATVTVTAVDPGGLSAVQSFGVTVPNRAPGAVGTIADLEVQVDSVVTLEVSGYFTDPDRDVLEYSAASSDTTRATVALAGDTVTVTGLAAGNTTVTVTARDPGGLSAEQSFAVEVPNRAPEAVGAIADVEVYVDGEVVVDVAAGFADPDGDELEFSAVASDTTRATVAVAGSLVTVTGVAVGSATVTVTARDPEGLSAEQSYGVTVPNRPPEAVGVIADQNVYVDSVVVVDVAGYFADPDGDALEYSASASDTTRVAVTVAESMVTVTGLAVGSATVTVTAVDPGGLSAEQGFGVAVPNRAPGAVGTIADLEVQVDSVVALEVSGYFTDPDRDALEYSAASSDTTRATVIVAGDTVTVTGAAAGNTTVTVTARDPGGLSAEQSFAVEVPNRAPEAVGMIADVEVYVDGAVVVDVAAGFADPDGDELEYSAVVSDTTRATVAVSGSLVTVTGVAVGSATVTVTARDPEGLSAEQSYGVAVPNRPPEAVGMIADLEVQVDSVVVVDVAEYFEDPDRETLEYAAAISEMTRVAVSVSGSTVTLSGVAKGNAAVTVTAQDPGGLFAEQSFEVTVPNRPPEVAEVIADLEVEVDGVVTLEVAVFFTDPDGDDLEYAAASSDSTRATVAVSGSTVTVRGVAAGAATVMVTARDSEGLSAAQSVVVTVPNRAPVAVGMIADVEVYVNSAAAVDVTAYFADPDEDELEYSASVLDTTLAAVAVSGGTVTVTGVAVGSTTVTVTARDPGGLAAVQSFAVTVPNQAPEAVGAIAPRVVERNQSVSFDVSPYFNDPDGDDLAYSATSSSTSRASVRFSGSVLVITGGRIGRATITVTAHDPDGLTAEQSFEVRVRRRNRAPRPAGTIPDQTAKEDGTTSVDVSPYFADPDGDALTYSANSSSTSTATVSVSGSTVSIAGESQGTAIITVTAEDIGGLTATQRFNVSIQEPNRAPQPVGTIPDQTVSTGGGVLVDISGYFTDPDGDDLGYSATSSSTATAAVTVSGSTVTIRGRSAGTATITVTAQDPGGLTATQRFEVTVTAVQNQAPQTVGTIPDAPVKLGEEISVDVEPYFTDPDGDDLTYSASSSDNTIATVEVSGSTVEVKGQAEGDATITVTARDPGGLTATQSFEIKVEDLPNQAPVVIRRIVDVELTLDERGSLPLTRIFQDPDGDSLSYTTTSTDDNVAYAEVEGDTLFVYPVAVGSASITVTATDPEGLFATDDFDVVVVAERFDIELGFTDDVTETQRTRIRAARSDWERVLRHTELSDVAVPDVVECLGLVGTNVGTVDDHLVLVDVGSIDGVGGTLAHAILCRIRSDGTPVVSAVQFDMADVDRVSALGSLGLLAFHELAHGLGFWTGQWDRHGLLVKGDDPHFTGALATAAFDAAGGTAYTDSKVPVAKPLSSHWRESVFGREGMTPLLTVGASNPFSAVTLQAMADIGYVVDVSLADDYQLPNTVPPKVAGDQAGRVYDLSNDVVRGPVMVLDSDGRIIRVIPPPPGSVVPSWLRREVQIERGGARNRPTGEPGREGPARETMWQIVTKPATGGRSR